MSETTPTANAIPSMSSRRTGGKAPPKLPLSVFEKAAESAAQYPDPATFFPNSILDANVALSAEEWQSQAGDILKQPITGIILSLRDGQPLSEQRLTELTTQSSNEPLVAVIAPTHHSDQGVSKIPSYITESVVPVAFSLSFKKGTTTSDDLKMILTSGHVVDLDVPWNTSQAESEFEWDSLQEIFSGTTTSDSEASEKGKAIVISNLLPPPHSLLISIVTLMNHPTYLAYQTGLSQLAFVPNVYLKLLPPSWDDPTPMTPNPYADPESTQTQSTNTSNQDQKDEWKRRVKMYLGPAIDAFGYSRIIFGTSPSPSSSSASTAHDWYALVREVVAELGVEQEGMDAIFGGNAKAVYSR